MILFVYTIKAKINCLVTMQLISAFVFATYIVQFFYLLNPQLKPIPSSVAVQPGLCRTWSETPKTISGDKAHMLSNQVFELVCISLFHAFVEPFNGPG